jgi:hypothetical protein
MSLLSSRLRSKSRKKASVVNVASIFRIEEWVRQETNRSKLSPLSLYANQPTNSVALVREGTIPTERPPLVGEGNANFCGKRGVAWSVRRIPYGRNLGF